MYGWRARIALILAHSNTVMEPEFGRLAPEGVSVHTSRVRIGGISVEGNLIAEQAMKHAVLAGRLAFRAGRIPRKRYATASSPAEGLVTPGPVRS